MSPRKFSQAQWAETPRRSARNTTRHDYREVNEFGLYVNDLPADYLLAQAAPTHQDNTTAAAIRTAHPIAVAQQPILSQGSNGGTASDASTPRSPPNSLPGWSISGEDFALPNATRKLLDELQESKDSLELPPKHGRDDSGYDSVDDSNDSKRARFDETKPDNPYSGLALRPAIWSNKRGGLCEALPYFKAYKGALYTKDNLALGFLIDQEVDIRDIFTGQVIITSLGGGREVRKIGNTNAMVRVGDAPNDSFAVNSLKQAAADNALIAVIAGECHPLYPISPPHPYAVLDYFRITHVWKERQLNKVKELVTVWRLRFEKAELHTTSWWDPNGNYTHDEALVPSATCTTCGVDSPTIFKVDWTCLNHSCADYYRTLVPYVQLNGLGYNDLEYLDEFLNQRTPTAFAMPLLKPDLPDLSGSHGTNLEARRGFVCPDCGCANRRVYWWNFICENVHCGRAWSAPMLPYPQASLDQENAEIDQHVARLRNNNGCNDRLAYNLNSEVVAAMDAALGSYNARLYFLLDGSNGNVIGSVAVLPTNNGINAAPSGPDALFRQLEVTDLGLKRNPAAVAGHKLEGLTRHFAQNFGAKYKFGVDVQSRSFAEAPEVILRALHRLIWAANAAVAATARGMAGMAVAGDAPPPATPQFNELLALGYMEKDMIGYHDDGERELGPSVGTISLGSPSIMKFRPKSRATGFEGLPRYGRGVGLFKPVLEVPLKHGDMVVMHGTHIHRFYEHAVEPKGGRRFSLTARHIDPGTQTEPDRALAAVNGKIPEESWAYTYDGN